MAEKQELRRQMYDLAEGLRMECTELMQAIRRSKKIDLQQAEHVLDGLRELARDVDVPFILGWHEKERTGLLYLTTHCINVALWNRQLGLWQGMSEEQCDQLLQTGFYHDIGKNLVSEEILHKPDKLTEQEYLAVRQHPIFSYELLRNAGLRDEEILQGVRGHHENISGDGYPDGKKGSDIAAFAKITALSDRFDAMLAHKNYKKEDYSPLHVLQDFYKNRFSDLDLGLVDLFVDRMCDKLVGCPVVLADGQEARIIFIEKKAMCMPIVECAKTGMMLETTEDLPCVSIG